MTPRLDSPTLPDDRLCAKLAPVMQTALRRQLWLFFLDGDDEVVGPVMPCADYPIDPAEPVITADLGPAETSEVFGARFAALMEEFGFEFIALVWERIGDAELDDDTRRWASALGGVLAARGVGVRAQMLLHDRGLRMLTVDEVARISRT